MTSIDGRSIKEGSDSVDLLSLISAAVCGGSGEVKTLLTKLGIEWIVVCYRDWETTTNISGIYRKYFYLIFDQTDYT